jgi:heme exporter protein B
LPEKDSLTPQEAVTPDALTPALSQREREKDADLTPALNQVEREKDADLTPALSQVEREKDADLTPALSQVERMEKRGEGGVHFLRAMGAVVWKDLAAEWRSREMLSSMLVFALLVIFIFNFALELDARARATVTAGVLWVTFAFAGTLGLNRSMAVEKDRGCLDGLLLAPVDRTAIYFGKMLANLLFMLMVAAIVLPVYSILYNTNLFNPGLLLVILLGAEGYVAVGTLLATMAVQARTRDILLPILLFPVAIPLLIAAVRASSGFLAGIPLIDIRPSLNLLIVFDVLFTAVAFMVFEFVVEE